MKTLMLTHINSFVSGISSFICAIAFGIAWHLDAHGQVGIRQIQLDELPVTMVYPTEAVAKAVGYGPFTLEVAPDAPTFAKAHRLVVLSHGTGGSPLADHALASQLARAGFVVAQPLHAGDNFRDTSKAGPDAFQSRPIEILQVIDALSKHPQWSALLALDRVGVHGMSAGGMTALTLAGAQWSVLNLIRHCNRWLELDAGFCLQGAANGTKRLERISEFERVKNFSDAAFPLDIKAIHGGRTPSTGNSEIRPDRRIAAVSVSVPVAAILSAESLARIHIPVAIVAAKNDQVLLPRFHSEYVLAHCKSCQKTAELEAGHFDLLWPWPKAIAQEVADSQLRGGLPSPTFDDNLRTAAFAKIVQFHLKHLNPAALRKLETAQIPGNTTLSNIGAKDEHQIRAKVSR